jgi:hypothetical protein
MNRSKLDEIREELDNIEGLRFVAVLEDEHKEIIRVLEEKRNTGVMDCLQREYNMLLLHDSKFREPDEKIVVGKGENLTFPGLPFPEVDALDVVVSSPSSSVHRALLESLHVSASEEEASLLVGFNL